MKRFILFALLLLASPARADWFVWDLGNPAANLAAFNALNKSFETVQSKGSAKMKKVFADYKMHYPNASGTQRYAEPTIHPVDGRVAMPIPMQVFTKVGDDVKAELWTHFTKYSYILPELDATWRAEQPE